MKVLVIDGQGGKMGKMLVEQLKKLRPEYEIIAVGTNSTATAVMMKAGADGGATGENSVIVCSRDADVIVGPLGIISADALLGEITPDMARAVAAARCKRVLLPVSRCNNIVVGVQPLPMAELVRMACEKVLEMEQDYS